MEMRGRSPGAGPPVGAPGDAPASTGGASGPLLPEPGAARDPVAALRRRVLIRLAVIAIASVAITALVYALTVGTRLGQLMGEIILGGRIGSPAAVVAAEGVLGQLSRVALVAGSVSVVSLALLQRRGALALVAGGVVLLANLTTQLLKQVVLLRTDMLDGLFYVLPNSFPSGHATAASAVAVALVLVLPPVLRSPTVLISAIAVALVGASTLLAGWHRMADAIGGVFVSTAWAAVLTAVLVWRRGVGPVGRRTAALGRVGAQVPLVLGLATLLLGSAAYLVAVVDPLGVLLYLAERGGSPALLAVGILITTGTSFLALGAIGLAIRDVSLDPRPAPQAAPGPD